MPTERQATVEEEAIPPLLDRLLVRCSRTFALNIPLLPEPARREVTVAYLLFRVADTLEDATRWDRDRKLAELERFAGLVRAPSGEGARRLSAGWLREPPCPHDGYLELLDRLPDVVQAAGTLASAAQDTIHSHTLRTVDGMASFVRREQGGELQLADLPDLRAYCYAVAGIVGEMLTELFLLDYPVLAPAAGELRRDSAAFGEALQLVNILKDSASDAREGRRYLPRGLSRAEVFAVARADLEAAGRYCARLETAGAPRGVLAFNALPMLLARATLDRVEERGPGAKLTRSEVTGILQELNGALDRRAAASLWTRAMPAGPRAAVRKEDR